MERQEFKNVYLDFDGSLAIITLNDPKALNAIGLEMVGGLVEALAEVTNPDRGVRCLILTGEGRGFCSGANLGDGAPERVGEQIAALQTHYHPILRCLRNLPFPFITAVNGPAVGIGMSIAAMMTYGAYLDEDISIPQSAVIIAIADTGVALLAGLAIFPLVFSFALEPSAGPGLIFVTVPIAFGQMDAGLLLGSMFFVLLSVAAVTSAISLLEPAVAYMEEALAWSRRATAILVGGACWMLGLATAFSFNDWSTYYPVASLGVLVDQTIFDVFDFVVTSWVQPGVGIMMAIFAGWILNQSTVKDALNLKNPDALWFRFWYFLLRIVCPAAILLVFAGAVWPDFIASMMPNGTE